MASALPRPTQQKGWQSQRRLGGGGPDCNILCPWGAGRGVRLQAVAGDEGGTAKGVLAPFWLPRRKLIS